MGSSLIFHGQDGAVRLDDATLTLTGATTAPGADGRSAEGAAAEEPLVVLRSDVTGVDLAPATLLAYGQLTITTRHGGRHTVRFPRDAQGDFENLQAIIKP